MTIVQLLIHSNIFHGFNLSPHTTILTITDIIQLIQLFLPSQISELEQILNPTDFLDRRSAKMYSSLHLIWTSRALRLHENQKFGN